MKTPKGLIVGIGIVMFLVSCAGAPKVPFKTLVEEADKRAGEEVILGGYVLGSRVRGDRTAITVLQTPLDWNTKPQTKNTSEGSFYVSYQGKFNANEHDPEDRITVHGKIAGLTEEKVEHCPSPCLKIESGKIRMWPAHVYYYRPSGGPAR
jgi:starvation-inducible outer membrane lipoprotein